MTYSIVTTVYYYVQIMINYADKIFISFDEDNKIILGNISEEELDTFGLTKDFKLNKIYMTEDRKKNLRYHRNTLNLLNRIKSGDE